MTIEELSQLHYLRRKIEKQQCRLTELEAAAAKSVSVIKRISGTSGKKDRLAEYAVEIAELQERLDLNLKKCFYELHRLNRYINSIDDSQIRMILSFRYINGLRWRQIAFKLGRKATEDNVRITHDRFLKNNM